MSIDSDQQLACAFLDLERERFHHPVNRAIVAVEDLLGSVGSLSLSFDEQIVCGIEEKLYANVVPDELDGVCVAPIDRCFPCKLRHDAIALQFTEPAGDEQRFQSKAFRFFAQQRSQPARIEPPRGLAVVAFALLRRTDFDVDPHAAGRQRLIGEAPGDPVSSLDNAPHQRAPDARRRIAS